MASLPPIDLPSGATGEGAFDSPAPADERRVLFDYLLRLGDDSLILGQRLGEWCGHAPSVEVDLILASVAAKAVKEVAYHQELSAEWVVRLGDGTEESRRRMAEGLDWMWRFIPELFEMDPLATRAAQCGIGTDVVLFRADYDRIVGDVLAQATLDAPADQRPILGGRRGHHGEHLGHLLAVMQFLPRTYPDATW